MTIEQTVEIPPNRRLFVEVPPEVPTGKVILSFTPVSTVDNLEQEEIPNTETIAAMRETEDMINGKMPCAWYKSPEDLIDALKQEINS